MPLSRLLTRYAADSCGFNAITLGYRTSTNQEAGYTPIDVGVRVLRFLQRMCDIALRDLPHSAPCPKSSEYQTPIQTHG